MQIHHETPISMFKGSESRKYGPLQSNRQFRLGRGWSSPHSPHPPVLFQCCIPQPSTFTFTVTHHGIPAAPLRGNRSAQAKRLGCLHPLRMATPYRTHPRGHALTRGLYYRRPKAIWPSERDEDTSHLRYTHTKGTGYYRELRCPRVGFCDDRRSIEVGGGHPGIL